VNRRERITNRQAQCQHCGREIAWRANPYRPFCSLSCGLIDLGVWLDERYRIPGLVLSVESTAADGGSHGSG
jgi:endogenous inhibitor of DNA gyrase (YacG/DUF329 family)